jgi:hypothetical protein
MSDIIDINVAQTVEEVTINVTEEVIQVNINQVNGGGGIESVVAGTNITVDNTDPLNPIINANADAVTSVNSDTGAVIVDLQSVTDEGNVVEYGAETTFAKYQTSADVFAEIRSTDDGFLALDIQVSTGEKVSYQGEGIVNQRGGVNKTLNLPFIEGILAMGFQSKIANFTAENEVPYIANGTLTVTDPTPVANRGYIVHVIGGTVTIGGVGYTTGALVYRYYDGSSWISKNYNQDLQSVTDNGSNIDGNDIVVKNGLIEVINNAEDKFADFTFDGFAITDDVTADVSAYKLGEISNNSTVYPLPTGATSQIATLLDIPSPITIDATPTDGSSNAVSSNGVFDALATKVSKSDYTPAHSILVQQSGTGTPTALSVGNNTLVGRLSGGGSDINDLSVSDVRTLLSIDTDLALKSNKNEVETFIFSKSGGSYGSHTGNTAETVLLSLDITGGEFVVSDLMTFYTVVNKTGTAGTATLRFRAGTAGTTADALIATGGNAAAANITLANERRRFQFLSGNILAGFRSTTASFNDTTAIDIYTQTSLTYSSDWKLTITVQLSNSADSVVLNQYRVGKIKSI